MRRTIALGVAALAAGAIALLFVPNCNKITRPDTVRYFELDPKQPFHMEFGRGSGWHGLDVIVLDHTGHLAVSRQPTRAGEVWTKSELTLPPAIVADIIREVNAEKLTGLAKAYSTRNIVDGTQWLFYVEQGGKQKVIYFDNNFPEAITRFAQNLDKILRRGGIGAVTWIPGGEEMNKAIWKRMDE